VAIKTHHHARCLREIPERAVHLKANQADRFTLEAGRVVVTPQTPGQLTLAERLALYDPVPRGGDPPTSDSDKVV